MKIYDAWRRRGLALEDRLMSVDWVRQVLSVLIALFMAAGPVYFLWAVALRRDFSPEAVSMLIGMAVVYVLVLAAFVAAFVSSSEHPWWYVFAFVVPLVGFPFLVASVRGLAAKYRPAADRASERERRLTGLDGFHRDVFRLRFDTVEGRFYSRRRTARRLGVPTHEVVEAERRIFAHLERYG